MLKKFTIIWTILSLIFITGCWSKKELDDLAIVLGVGIDKGKNNRLELAAEVAKPKEMGGGQTGGGGGQQDPAVLLTSDGITVFEAVRNMLDINSRKLFFSHNQLLVIGEALARDGVQPVIDFFERDPELRTEVPIAVAASTAKNILDLRSILENSATMSMHKALQTSERTGRLPNVQFHEFLLRYNGKITAPVAPYVTLTHTGDLRTYHFSNLAVFKNDKMVGTLNKEESQGYLWIVNKMGNSVLPLKTPGHEKFLLSIEILEAETVTNITVKKGQPIISVKVKAAGNFGEVQYPVDITKPDVIPTIEKGLEDEIKKQMLGAIKKTQKSYKVDIFGFGEQMRVKYPKVWRKIHTDWHEIFAKASVQVSVKAQIRHSGEKTRPSHVID